jgi:hypothetical protein
MAGYPAWGTIRFGRALKYKHIEAISEDYLQWGLPAAVLPPGRVWGQQAKLCIPPATLRAVPLEQSISDLEWQRGSDQAGGAGRCAPSRTAGPDRGLLP